MERTGVADPIDPGAARRRDAMDAPHLPFSPRPPKASKTPRRVCFLHVPKTGGTSLHLWLVRRFNERHVCPARDARELLQYSRNALRRYRLFSGHFAFGFRTERYVGKPLAYVTLVREPVAQFLSHYRHIRHIESHPLRVVRDKYRNLSEFLDSPDAAHHLGNFQVRYLALYERLFDPVTLRGLASRDQAVRDQTGWEIIRRETEVSDSHLLAAARANLKKCAFVGVTERMDDCYQTLARAFGWDAGHHPGRANVTPDAAKKEPVTDGDLEKIQALTRLDAQLYESARDMFEDQCRQPAPPHRAGGQIARLWAWMRRPAAAETSVACDQPHAGTRAAA
jgi:Sulfotransferase family